MSLFLGCHLCLAEKRAKWYNKACKTGIITEDCEEEGTAVKKLICLIIVMVIVLGGCIAAVPSDTMASATASASTGSTEQTQATSSTQLSTEALPDKMEVYIKQMSLREKVGQLFIVSPEDLLKTQEGKFSYGVTEMSEPLKTALMEYPVGGVVMFAGNLVSPEQIKVFNKDLQAASTIPLFITVDEEGGRVARIANHPGFNVKKYKSAAKVGASGDTAAALEMGQTIGAYLSEYGFTMNFAPVGDVFTNPENTVIGNRAFSSDATVAAAMAKAVACGLREQGITPVYKHFPGHGDTVEDSHKELALSNKTAEQMKAGEWLPFQNLTADDCVMVGHIATPNITGDKIPATLSYSMIHEYLRGYCRFDGLVITDSFSMEAIAAEYTAAEAAVAAINAGCDVILLPEDFEEAFNSVMAAVENGTITMERLQESVGRVLRLKEKSLS